MSGREERVEQRAVFSSMKMSTQSSRKISSSLHDSIRMKRGVFKTLPIAYSNDMEHGAIWITVGSGMMIAIPIPVLVGLYQRMWGNHEYKGVNKTEHVATLVLQVIMGIGFTVGSALLIRAVSEPTPTPLFTWRHICTDELHSSWWFFWSTAPAVVIFGLFSVEVGSGEYVVGFIGSLFALLAMGIAVWACYPIDTIKAAEEEGHYKTQYFVPYAQRLLCGSSWAKQHLINDWLISMWIFFMGSFMSFVACAVGILYLAAYSRGKPEYILDMYLAIANTFEMFLFLVGNAYWVAGSYPEESDNILHAVKDVEEAAMERTDLSTKENKEKDSRADATSDTMNAAGDIKSIKPTTEDNVLIKPASPSVSAAIWADAKVAPIL